MAPPAFFKENRPIIRQFYQGINQRTVCSPKELKNRMHSRVHASFKHRFTSGFAEELMYIEWPKDLPVLAGALGIGAVKRNLRASEAGDRGGMVDRTHW